MNEELNLLLRQLHLGQEDWYANIFHQYPEAIAVCQTESGFPSTIIECNEAFEQNIKQASISLIGRDFMTLLSKGEKRKFFIKSLGNTKHNNSIHHLPIAFDLVNGKQNTFALSLTPLDSQQGQLLMITLHANKEQHALIEDGMEHLNIIQHQVFFSLKTHDILQFNYISQSANEVLGYTNEQLLLNPFLFWFNCHPEDFDRIKKVWHQKEHTEQSIEVRFIHHNGQMVWLRLSIITNQNEASETPQRYLLAQDITYTKKLERLEEKKNSYRHLLLHSAKQLLRDGHSKVLSTLIDTVGRDFPADRIGIYALEGSAIQLNHNYFKPALSYDDISENISAQYYLTEFKQELTTLPLLLLHPDANCEALEQKHYKFLKNRQIISSLMVPLHVHHKLVGLILCTNQHYTRCWDRSDMYFIHELSALTESYLSNSQHTKKLF